eukprot:13272-Pelagococcus_subviridis.AAC.1
MNHPHGARGVIPERVHVSRVRDVALHAADARARELVAQRGDGGVDARLRAAADADAIAATEKLSSDGETDALRRAGDDDAEAVARRGRVRDLPRAIVRFHARGRDAQAAAVDGGGGRSTTTERGRGVGRYLLRRRSVDAASR